MAKAKASHSTKQKANANPVPKKRTSKIQKPSQAAPASQGLRRSGRETKLSSKAQEAVANAPSPTQKPKTGLRNETTPNRANNADADHFVDTNTNTPPPSKQPTTKPTTKPIGRTTKTRILNSIKIKGKSNPLESIAEDADAALIGSSSLEDQINHSERASGPKKTQSGRETRLSSRAQEAVATAPPLTRKTRSGPIERKTGQSSKDARTGSSNDTTRDPDASNPAGLVKTRSKDAITGVPPKDMYIDIPDDTDVATDVLPVKKKAKTNSNGKSGKATFNNADADCLNQDTDAGPPVAYLGREATRGGLHQEGWMSDDFPEGFRRCFVPDCRLPSPFVLNFGDRHEELMGVVDTHVLDSVRRLWERAHIDRDLRAEMLKSNAILDEGNAISDDGEHGRFYELARNNHREFQSAIYAGGDAPFSIELNDLRTDRTATKSNDAGKSLEVRRLFNIESGEAGYFIVNPDLNFLAVNGSAVSHNMIAGPLPDFAVLTIDEAALFWFRTRQAVEGYLPERRVSAGTKRKRDDAAKTVTWEEILNNGLEDSRRSYRESLNHGNHRTGLPIRDAANMTIDDVWLAIGSFWEGLRSGTPKTSLDAYAGLDLFYPPETYHYSSEPQPEAGRGKRFFMPILFAADKDTVQMWEAPSRRVPAKDIKGRGKSVFIEDEEEEEEKKGMGEGKGKKKDQRDEVGHLLLVVAQVVGEPNQIQLHIYDSSEEEAAIGRRHVLQRSRDLIKRAKWPNLNVDTALKYRPSVYHRVPQQQPKTNTCGLYSILNAWALMLGIPIQHQDLWRPRRNAQRQFVKAGLEIVNLAMAGFMSSRTIQAFMNVHGYSEEQSPTNIPESAILVDATAMQPIRLERKLQSQRRVDLGVSEGRSVSHDETAPSGSSVEIDEEAVMTLMSTLMVRREDAVVALTRSRGDLSAAAGILAAELPVAEADGSAQLEGSMSSGLTSLGPSGSSQDSGPSASGPGSFQSPGPSPSGQSGSSQESSPSPSRQLRSSRLPGPSSSGQPESSYNAGSNGGAGHAAKSISFASAGEPWAWKKVRPIPDLDLNLSD